MSVSLPTASRTCTCKKQRQRQRLSFGMTLFIAILPKCPFCAFGYSSVVVLCSGTKLQHYEANRMGYLAIGLAVAVLLSLFWNFKGQSTWLAAAFAVWGIAPLAHAQVISGNPIEYFIGTSLILLAVLLNGRWEKRIRHIT